MADNNRLGLDRIGNALQEGLRISPAGQMAASFRKWVERHGLEARAVADKTYPGQSWDDSQKNALRHSLWIGRMANDLGTDGRAGPVSSQVAKGIGYLHEGVTAFGNWATGKKDVSPTDMRHDLNNNAVGALMAQETIGQQALADTLVSMSRWSQKEQPPGVLHRNRGYLTHSKN